MALQLGISDVRGWLDSLEPGALDEWQAYYRIEPWDLQRIYLQASAETGSGPKMISALEAAASMSQRHRMRG